MLNLLNMDLNTANPGEALTLVSSLAIRVPYSVRPFFEEGTIVREFPGRILTPTMMRVMNAGNNISKRSRSMIEIDRISSPT